MDYIGYIYFHLFFTFILAIMTMAMLNASENSLA